MQAAAFTWGDRGARVNSLSLLLGAEAGFITGTDLLIDGGVIAALRAGRWQLRV